MTSLEPEDISLGEQELEYETYRFFGVPFKVGFDVPESAKIYRKTYGHLKELPENGRVDNAITFKVLSESLENDAKAIVVENGKIDHLVNVFRRGSNRHRFRIEAESDDGFFRVADAFLENKPVMLIGERTCFFLDHERWRAYAESVIFHTVLSHIPGHLVMHAGVVSTNGRAVVLCGEANRGKTTLTLALVREGCKFLSDEVAFIDRKLGVVHPFPRALGLREKTLSMFSELNSRVKLQPTKSLSGDDKWLVDIDDMFPGCRGDSCKVGSIIFMDGFSDSAKLTPITSAEALLECTKFSHTAEENPFQSMLAVADVVQAAKCYRLQSGSVSETVRIVTDSLKE